MSKLTESAKGKDCLVRIPGVCNFNPETTVLAHLGGAGMGIKEKDFHGSFCCSDCHDLIDGRVNRSSHGYSKVEIKLMHFEGIKRTQDDWLSTGLVITK